MKYKELTKRLRAYGWFLKRQGSNHEIWSNGQITEPVPRHREIRDLLAQHILKVAGECPRKENL